MDLVPTVLEHLGIARPRLLEGGPDERGGARQGAAAAPGSFMKAAAPPLPGLV
jgi:hypothetical protein